MSSPIRAGTTGSPLLPALLLLLQSTAAAAAQGECPGPDADAGFAFTHFGTSPGSGQANGGVPGSDEVHGIAVNPVTGNIAVGGTTTGMFPGEQRVDGSGTATDAFVMLRSATGTQLWVHQFGTARYDDLRAIVVHPITGNIVVGGLTPGMLPGQQQQRPNPGRDREDGFVVMLNKTDGAELWVHQFGATNNPLEVDQVQAIAVHPDTGNIVAGGFTGTTRLANGRTGPINGFVTMLSAVSEPTPD